MSRPIRVDDEVKAELARRARLIDTPNGKRRETPNEVIRRHFGPPADFAPVEVKDLKRGDSVYLEGITRTVDDVIRVGPATRFDYRLETSSWDATLDGHTTLPAKAAA